MNEYLIAFLFVVQAVALLVTLHISVRIVQNRPIVERKDGYMEVPDPSAFLNDAVDEEKLEVEEPPISWNSRMSEDAQEKQS